MSQLQWDDYAVVFAPVTTKFQSEMYEAATHQLSGVVLDCGCGPCKLAPYLATGSQRVSAYVGVDYSEEMVNLGKQTLGLVDRQTFKVCCGRIEDTEGNYNSAVSLQSYYSWDNPLRVLRHIWNLLSDGGRLVLASANKKLDIESLLCQSSNEWLLYPGWDRFAEYNRQLAVLPQGKFVSLDELVGELRGVGFSILDANTELFQGGLNFVVAQK